MNIKLNQSDITAAIQKARKILQYHGVKSREDYQFKLKEGVIILEFVADTEVEQYEINLK